MASYQPQHLQAGRRADVRRSFHSLDSSWIITELPRATEENVFSDTVSSPLSDTRESAPPESEHWAEQLQASPTSMIRFPTHDGRGGFTLALSSHRSSGVESRASRHTATPSPSCKSISLKAISTHASTSSSILDDALPRQPEPTTDLSQRIHAWTQEQQQYVRLRHKRRKLSVNADQRIPKHGLEGWLWRFVSRLIGMDDHILQIVLGESLLESQQKPMSEGPLSWEDLIHRMTAENFLASAFPSPHFQQLFLQNEERAQSTSMSSSSRPAGQPKTLRDMTRKPTTRLAYQQPTSSWSSLPPDPIQTAPFLPTPVHLSNSQISDSSHAPWGIEDDDIPSTSTDLPDDYWDRELTIPLVWHIVKSYISTRLPILQRNEETTIRSCKEESVYGRWDDPGDERPYYWHESVDGASSTGLGLGGLGAWGEA